MLKSMQVFFALSFVVAHTVQAWSPAISLVAVQQQQQQQRRVPMYRRVPTHLFVLEGEKTESDENNIERTSFDQAGKSLIEEEDKERLEQMGDFDQNPEYQTDSIEKMRAAIRARTTDLGIEKSKITADYIKSRQDRAINAGPGGGTSPDQFGGLDLSKISATSTSKQSKWNEEMPSMFYDPDEELSKEEREEVDPIMKLNPYEQGMNELKNAKWPGPGAALKEVGLLLAVMAFSAAIIIGWDKFLREIYTSFGFIPTKEEILNYASRFDGLDLPQGWTENMSEQDVSKFADTVSQSSSSSSTLPGL